AADDQRIADALEPFGTRVLLTDPAHPSGTDRVAEAAKSLDADLIVNVQGDEPEIDPAALAVLVETLANSDAPMATLATNYPTGASEADPNLVKLARSMRGRALYFSRSPIPFDRGGHGRPPEHPLLLHVGVYAYRRRFLAELATLSPTPLEQTEKLEQLRVLEHGHSIAVAVVDHRSHGIDTPQQYAEFVRRHQSRTPPSN
ncbi:MAG: 3-deoxy-manno-octulosonate cytidylyltransferase, partial [Planctomycetota bacterium]